MAAGGQGGEPPRGPLYKTDLCWHFQSGLCRSGDVCPWAHGEHELRERPAWATDLRGSSGKGKGKAAGEAATAMAEELAPQMDFAWFRQESEPAKEYSAARSVLLGAEVTEKLRLLNSEGQLQTPIDVNAIVGPLSQLDPETALDILDGLHERGQSVDDPTAWVIEAAGAIPPWENEAEELGDGEEDQEQEDEIDPALLGIEIPIRAAKRRRTAAGDEDQDVEAIADDDGEEAKEEPAAAGQPPPATGVPPQQLPFGMRPQLPAGKAAGKGLPDPSAAGLPGGQWRPIRYKTDLCNSWRMQNGFCPAGPSCNFAHGPQELRPYPAGWSPVRPLVAPLRPGFPGAAAPPNVVTPPLNLRTVPCVLFQKGQCVAGEACRFAHSEQQARLARLQQQTGQAAVPQGSFVPQFRPVLPGIMADTPVLREGQDLTMDQICNYKTRLCVKFAMGRCTAGDNCLLAHGQSELQQPWDAPQEEEADENLDEVDVAEEDEGEEEGPAEEEPEPEEVKEASAAA